MEFQHTVISRVYCAHIYVYIYIHTYMYVTCIHSGLLMMVRRSLSVLVVQDPRILPLARYSMAPSSLYVCIFREFVFAWTGGTSLWVGP